MNEKKEFLLNLIDSATVWRATLLERYPEERNRVAAEALARLYDYIERLKDDHPLLDLKWRWNTYDQLIEKMNDDIRMFGYRNTFETPDQFIKRFIQDAIDQTLKEEKDRAEEEEYGFDEDDEEEYAFDEEDEGYRIDKDENYSNEDEEEYRIEEEEEY